jgi:hypothetical protein
MATKKLSPSQQVAKGLTAGLKAEHRPAAKKAPAKAQAKATETKSLAAALLKGLPKPTTTR